MSEKANLFLFYGEETFRLKQKVRVWKKEFVKKFGELNLYCFDGEDLEVGKVSNVCRTMGFFAEKKMVVIENWLKNLKKEDGEKVMELVSNLDKETILVLVEEGKLDARIALTKLLNKIAKVEEFKKMSLKEMRFWLKNECGVRGLKISEKNLDYMLGLGGDDLWKWDQELKKLKLLVGDEEVKELQIEEMVSDGGQVEIFQLTDAIGKKNWKMFLEVLRDMIEGGDEAMGILFRVYGHFRSLVGVRSRLDRGMKKSEVLKDLKMHPFYFEKLYVQAMNFSMEELVDFMGSLQMIDVGVKTGKIKVESVCGFMEMKFCGGRGDC